MHRITALKKLVLLLMITIALSELAISTSRAGEAKPAIALEKAEGIAREILSIPGHYKVTFSMHDKYTESEPIWLLRFSDGQEPYDGHSIVVGISDSTGALVNFWWATEESDEPYKYTFEQALEISADFLQKVLSPSQFQQIYLTKSNLWDYFDYSRFEFTYRRMVNGYLFLDDEIKVCINKITGQVTLYSREWSKVNIPTPVTLLSPKEAAELFHQNIGLELGYVSRSYYDYQSQQDKRIIEKAYYPRFPDIFMNAQTGVLFSEYNSHISKVAGQQYEPLAGSPLATAKSVNLSMEQAMEIARKFGNIPTDYLLKNNLYTGQQWFFSWTHKEIPEKNIAVGVDEKTGEITGYWNYSSKPKNDLSGKVIGREQAQKLAIDFIKKVIPSKAHMLGTLKNGNLFVSTDGDNPEVHDFYFPMFVNGLPFREKGVNISFNIDGTIKSYEAKIEESIFPQNTNLITEKEAKAIFNRRFRGDLSYITINRFLPTEEIIPVYRFGTESGHTTYINATTGFISTYDGIPYDDQRIIEVIKPHWAEKDVARLVSMRVINPKDRPFDINEPITRAEIIKMLIRAMQINPFYSAEPSFADVKKDNLYFGYIGAAYLNSIILGDDGKFRPDSHLTREEMAVILSKVVPPHHENRLGISFFKDADSISPWAKNGVDLSTKSGLIKGDEKGYFNPKKKVTYGETAALLARLIERID